MSGVNLLLNHHDIMQTSYWRERERERKSLHAHSTHCQTGTNAHKTNSNILMTAVLSYIQLTVKTSQIQMQMLYISKKLVSKGVVQTCVHSLLVLRPSLAMREQKQR